MSDKEATARPWRVSSDKGTIIGDDERLLANAWVGPRPCEECEANAALIVRAVNCHDELVALVTEAVELLEWVEKRRNPQWDGDATDDSFIGKARAALAKATGTTP